MTLKRDPSLKSLYKSVRKANLDVVFTEYFVRKSDFGVIANDVLEVFPVAVRTREDGTLAVDYEKLCALAFQAIVELNEELEQIKNK